MPVIIPSGFAQIVLNYTGDVFASGRGATVLGFGAPGGISVDADVFAGQVRDAWEDHLQSQTLNNITLETVYWATTTQSGFVPVNAQGTITGAGAPPNTSVLMSYSTGFKGPRARGRSYFPGVLTAGNVNELGFIENSRFIQLDTAFTAFFNQLLATTPQVILQRDEPGQASPPISPPPQVISRVLREKAATQRRRLRA